LAESYGRESQESLCSRGPAAIYQSVFKELNKLRQSLYSYCGNTDGKYPAVLVKDIPCETRSQSTNMESAHSVYATIKYFFKII
jgi:hypothetical protein